MNKRLALFIVIVLAVLIGYNHFVMKPYAQKQQKEALVKKITTPPQKQASPKAPGITKSAVQPPVQEELPAEAIEAAEEKQTDIYTKVFTIAFSNKGAVITSIKLLNYLDESRAPVELVPRYSEMTTYPFSVRFNDPEITLLENNALYQMVESSQTDAHNHTIKVIEFTYNDGKGNYFEKNFFFDNGYLIHFEGKFIVHSKAAEPFISWGPGIQSITAKQKKDFGWGYKESLGLLWKNNSRVQVNHKKIKDTAFPLESVQWSGIHNNFFLIAFIPYSENNKVLIEMPANASKVEVNDNLLVNSIQQFQVSPVKLDLFAGPKDPEVLKPLGHDLIEAIDYGFFGILAKILLVALKFLYTYVGNYGLAIIILTIVIRVLLYPLTYKSMQSMKKMQELQPQMQKIKDNYKKVPFNDPRKQKMNQEVMELYKKHGVNPAGGCLPLLLQLPVLWGFYSLLSIAIELRDQPFIFWLADLSRPDPYYVTPLLMGATMVWQQKISPTSLDPAQQKIMMLMPIFFTYIFLNAQSGLVIYWLFNNILSIIQQQYLTKKSKNTKKS